MECHPISLIDIPDILQMHIGLLNEIGDETGDKYFRYDDVTAEDEITKEMESVLENPEKVVYVAKDQGCCIGFISGEIRSCFIPVSSVKRVGYICGAYVRPEYRGRGVLRELEKNMSRFFRDNDISFIELNVMTKNPAAEKSWNALGYSVFRLHMRKRID